MVANSTSNSSVNKVIGDLASRNTIVIDVDNAVDESQVTDASTFQLSPTTRDTTVDPSSSISNVTPNTATLEEFKSVARHPSSTSSHIILESNHNPSLPTETSNIDSTIRNMKSSSMNSSKDIANVTASEGDLKMIKSTKMAKIIEQREALPTTAAVDAMISRKPTLPLSHQPKAVKRKKVAQGYETKAKKKYVAKKLTKSSSKVEISTVSSSPSTRNQDFRKGGIGHSTLAHRQNINAIVVGQNELVFDSNKPNVSPASTTSNDHITRESKRVRSTTISSLWGMIEEVAYDTKRKSILKS